MRNKIPCPLVPIKNEFYNFIEILNSFKMRYLLFAKFCFLFFALSINSYGFEKDTFKTSKGDLTITFVGHGTLMMEFNGKVIHIDPVGSYANYDTLSLIHISEPTRRTPIS